MLTARRMFSASVVALVLLLVVAATSHARTWVKERPTPARWGFETEVHDNGQRCTSEFQLVVTPVAGARSYRAEYWDGYWRRTDVRSGPPFEHITGDDFPHTNPSARTATTWGITGVSGPVPCETMGTYLPRFPRPPKAWALIEYEDEPDVVVGNVTTTKGNKPVAGVRVRVSGPSGVQSITTDRRGTYRFVLKRRGMHRISASGPRICLYQQRAVFTNFPCVRSTTIDARGGERHSIGFSRMSGFLVSGRVSCDVAPDEGSAGIPGTYISRPARSKWRIRIAGREVAIDPATSRWAVELDGNRTYTARIATYEHIMDKIGISPVPAKHTVVVRDKDVTGVDFHMPALVSQCGWDIPPGPFSG